MEIMDFAECFFFPGGEDIVTTFKVILYLDGFFKMNNSPKNKL